MKVNNENGLLLKAVDLISVETIKIYEFLNENNTFNKKVEFVRNGFYSKENAEIIKFQEKENVFITVGRIGDFHKNNEVLLEAFSKFSIINKEWNLEVIGPIQDDFLDYIDNYYKLNPHLVDRVTFTGSILDRNMLEEKYRRAKIFVLTSRSEGFPLVFLEAIKSGCTVITSNITSANDITKNERYGAIFPVGDSDSLVEKMIEIVNDNEKLKNNCEELQKFAYENYSRDKISVHINHLINNGL